MISNNPVVNETSLNGFKLAENLFEQARKLADSPAENSTEIHLLREKIGGCFREIHQTQDPDKQALSLLSRAYNTLIPNTVKDSLIKQDSSLRFYANSLTVDTPPVHRNTGYGNLAFLTVSTYHTISAPITGFRLLPSSLGLVPKSLLKAAGSLNHRVVDFLAVTLDTRAVSGISREEDGRPLNVNTHPWTHKDILPGQDIRRKISMGLFPIWGIMPGKLVTKHKRPQPIGIGELTSLNVHSHAAKKGNPDPGAMLYSPDDAHFNIDITPFSATWLLALDGDKRVLISRLMMVHTYEDPFMKVFVDSSRNCPTLDSHLYALQTGIAQVTEAVLKPILTALDGDHPEAGIKLFDSLPEWHKTNVYKHASLLKKPLDPVNQDFGRLAFLNDERVTPSMHLTKGERVLVVKRHIRELFRVLSGEMTDLLNPPDRLSKLSKDAVTLIQLAKKFREKEGSALEKFVSLSKDLQNTVFKAIWRMNGRPLGDALEYGKKQFKLSSQADVAKALDFAAMYLPLSEPLAGKDEDSSLQGIDRKEKKEKKKGEKEKPTSTTTKIPSTSSKKNSESNPKLTEILDTLDILSSIDEVEQRSLQLHKIFDRLKIPKTLKYQIYEDLGKSAGKPSDKALEYGRVHFGQDLKALKSSLLKRMS